MEDSISATKDQNSNTSVRKSILRYPLRSAGKLKDNHNQPIKSPDSAVTTSTSKRGRPPSSVSKSVSVLELSAKDKSGKPPRRLSIPTKSTASPLPKPANNITPISEARVRRSANGQDKCDTPLSDVSRSSVRRKFNILSSSSYWLQQIKLSESAAKHSISLGFFKLALEAGSEPLPLLRDELKSYVRKHSLAEHGETVKDLFDRYEISETLEQLQVSETCSHVPEEATTPSDDGVCSVTSSAGTRKLKPKSLNTDSQISSAKLSSRKETVQRTNTATKTRASVTRSSMNARMVAETGGNNIKKKVQNPGKQQPNNGEEKIKNEDDKPVVEGVIAKPLDIKETLEGNKENLDAPLIGEISVTQEN